MSGGEAKESAEKADDPFEDIGFADSHLFAGRLVDGGLGTAKDKFGKGRLGGDLGHLWSFGRSGGG